MDFRQLRTFSCVAELGSLSKASDTLRVAQPALSRQIKLLEHELRTELFTRNGRGMVLTEAGRLLLARTPGIGPKLAQRIVLELKDKAPAFGHVDPALAQLSGDDEQARQGGLCEQVHHGAASSRFRRPPHASRRRIGSFQFFRIGSGARLPLQQHRPLLLSGRCTAGECAQHLGTHVET